MVVFYALISGRCGEAKNINKISHKIMQIGRIVTSNKQLFCDDQLPVMRAGFYQAEMSAACGFVMVLMQLQLCLSC